MCEEEEIHDVYAITPKLIIESCKKHDLYTFPELNEELYLHYCGFQKIAALEPYVNLKSLWLNNNAIGLLEGLNSLKNLVCLYLSYNVITEISGLDELENLETLVLSHNYISKISGLSNLKKLHSLEIDHNQISSIADMNELKDVKTLGVLNLGSNKIETEDFMQIISELPDLAVLKIEGNPIARTMVNYRRRIIVSTPKLAYLDQQPVDELERKCAELYLTVGKDAAIQERQRVLQEREDFKEKNRRELKRINKEYALANGIDISNDNYFRESGSETESNDINEID